jgi:hypothetical protein
VNGLLQRVERKKTQTCVNRSFRVAGLLVMTHQTSERLDGELMQALPLDGEPLLEHSLVQHHPGE